MDVNLKHDRQVCEKGRELVCMSVNPYLNGVGTTAVLGMTVTLFVYVIQHTRHHRKYYKR